MVDEVKVKFVSGRPGTLMVTGKKVWKPGEVASVSEKIAERLLTSKDFERVEEMKKKSKKKEKETSPVDVDEDGDVDLDDAKEVIENIKDF